MAWWKGRSLGPDASSHSYDGDDTIAWNHAMSNSARRSSAGPSLSPTQRAVKNTPHEDSEIADKIARHDFAASVPRVSEGAGVHDRWIHPLSPRLRWTWRSFACWAMSPGPSGPKANPASTGCRRRRDMSKHHRDETGPLSRSLPRSELRIGPACRESSSYESEL